MPVPTSNWARPLLWRHNGRDNVSNHQHHDCWLNRSFRRESKKTSKLRVTGLCAVIHMWPVISPHKWPVTRKMFSFDDVRVWREIALYRNGCNRLLYPQIYIFCEKDPCRKVIVPSGDIDTGLWNSARLASGSSLAHKHGIIWFVITLRPYDMMTSLLAFFCGQFTGHQWIPRAKASDAELWCFFLSRVNNREAGDLRRHRTHYDVTAIS